MNDIQITPEQMLAKIGELTMVSQAQAMIINRQGERIKELEKKLQEPNVAKKDK